MRMGIIPEGFQDWLALRSRRFPRPALDVMATMLLSRAVMAGVHFQVFDLLRAGPRTAAELARESGSDPHGMALLLEALASADYLERTPGGYRNTALARRWLTSDSPSSLGNFVRFNYDQWNWVSHLEEYIQHGEARDIHQKLDEGGWRSYLLGLADLARLPAQEVVKRVRLRSPRHLLDLGGGHCQYSIALCRAHPSLRVTVVDLEPALGIARERVAQAGLADRFTFAPGDLLRAPLGENCDVALLFNVVHHLDEAANREILAKAHRALRPGGVLTVLETFREGQNPRDQFGSLLALFFGVTSRRQTYSFEQVGDWLLQVGFDSVRRKRLKTAPFASLLLATK